MYTHAAAQTNISIRSELQPLYNTTLLRTGHAYGVWQPRQWLQGMAACQCCAFCSNAVLTAAALPATMLQRWVFALLYHATRKYNKLQQTLACDRRRRLAAVQRHAPGRMAVLPTSKPLVYTSSCIMMLKVAMHAALQHSHCRFEALQPTVSAACSP